MFLSVKFNFGFICSTDFFDFPFCGICKIKVPTSRQKLQKNFYSLMKDGFIILNYLTR